MEARPEQPEDPAAKKRASKLQAADRARRQKYRQTNRDKIREYRARWEKQHPEKLKEYTKRYRTKNRTKIRALRKARRERLRLEDPEKFHTRNQKRNKRYREHHPDKVREYLREYHREYRRRKLETHAQRLLQRRKTYHEQRGTPPELLTEDYHIKRPGR